MPIVMYQIIIQFVLVNLVTQEMHNLDASNLVANRTMNVAVIRLVEMENVLMFVQSTIHVRFQQYVMVRTTGQAANVHQVWKAIHLLNVNDQNVMLTMIVQMTEHVLINVVLIHVFCHQTCVHQMQSVLQTIMLLIVNVQNICQMAIHSHSVMQSK
jgi:hypothetical protein